MVGAVQPVRTRNSVRGQMEPCTAKVWLAIASGGPRGISVFPLRELTGLDEEPMKTRLQWLRRKGYAAYHGDSGGGAWRLTEAIPPGMVPPCWMTADSDADQPRRSTTPAEAADIERAKRESPNSAFDLARIVTSSAASPPAAAASPPTPTPTTVTPPEPEPKPMPMPMPNNPHHAPAAPSAPARQAAPDQHDPVRPVNGPRFGLYSDSTLLLELPRYGQVALDADETRALFAWLGRLNAAQAQAAT